MSRYYCTTCHEKSFFSKSSFNPLIFIILICFYIFPGVLYLLFTFGGKCCSNCGKKTLIPLTSAILKNTDNLTELQNAKDFESKDNTKCIYCAEIVKKEAVICKHCGSNLRLPKERSEKEVVEPSKDASTLNGIYKSEGLTNSFDIEHDFKEEPKINTLIVEAQAKPVNLLIESLKKKSGE